MTRPYDAVYLFSSRRGFVSSFWFSSARVNLIIIILKTLSSLDNTNCTTVEMFVVIGTDTVPCVVEIRKR